MEAVCEEGVEEIGHRMMVFVEEESDLAEGEL